MTITALATKRIASMQFRGKDMILRKINLNLRIQTLVALLILGGAVSASADDTFALAPSSHVNLTVFGPKGEQIAELSVPTISQSVTVGSTSFQISYGRDANNFITAIIAPSSSQPQDLHFTVLNKTIDADKQAVVTLTFQDSRHVTVDPGYIGSVTVNSHSLHHRDLADSAPLTAPAPATVTQIPHAAPRTTADVEPRDVPSPVVHSAPAPAPVVHSAPAPVAVSHPEPVSTISQVNTHTVDEPIIPDSQNTAALSNDAASPPVNGPVPVTPPPLLGSMLAQPPLAPPKGVANMPQAPSKKMYWAEPITPPSGAAPSVGIDQMKLVAVHGPVSVNLPTGETKPGTDGMSVPSGSSITTGQNGSAAVFIGGVDSARFTSNTQAKVTEKFAGSDRKTNINLHTGTVFARVGHRPGEKQDFEVETPQGVAAARGTSYAVCVTDSKGHEVTVCATQDGVVTMTDSADGHQITVTPLNNGQVSIGSAPRLPASLLSNIFAAFIADLQQFNTNMQAIANNPNPTPAQLAYYNSNLGFDVSTQFYDANSDNLNPLFATAADPLMLDTTNDINLVVPAVRRAQNQLLVPFGDVELSKF